jgi:hypothetical protein
MVFMNCDGFSRRLYMPADEGNGNESWYGDAIAERSQAYAWLMRVLAMIARREDARSTELLREGMSMLVAIRQSIPMRPSAIIKEIRGGK